MATGSILIRICLRSADHLGGGAWRPKPPCAEPSANWKWAWQTAFGAWFVENVNPTHQKPAMSFAAAKARDLGLLDDLPLPIVGKACSVCGETFREDGVAGSCLERFGSVDHIDFCNPCMRGVVYGARWESPHDRAGVINWLRQVAQTLERIPSQSFPTIEEFRAASREERKKIVQLCQERPSSPRVKDLFGTWLEALTAAGLLQDGSRRLMRGTQCLARDGHLCFSLGEKTIDDLLDEMGLDHEKEPRYPDSNLRADFLLGEVFVEFLGLKGDPAYDEKTTVKQRLCRSEGLSLLLIDPEDLLSRRRLSSKIRRAVGR